MFSGLINCLQESTRATADGGEAIGKQATTGCPPGQLFWFRH
tara:strand:- start:704 stop:829 length:126 start_codon:yes stop_codon:yes gene_type:complete